MYSQLLVSALDSAQRSEGEPSASEALARLLRRRVGLDEKARPEDGVTGAYATVVDHLAYDVALVDFVRLLGIECDVSEFDRPETARARLERELSDRGIPLDDLLGQHAEADGGDGGPRSLGAVDPGWRSPEM